MTVPVAHPGHWLVSATYFLPVVGFLVWLGFITVRDRWRRRKGDRS